MKSEVETIGPADLAAILHVSKSLIYKAANGHSPLLLPPRIILPGSNRLLWMRADVIQWLCAHRQLSQESQPAPALEATPGLRRRRGRPRKEEAVALARARGAA